MIQNIHFYCCSDVAMAVDMAEPLVKELNKPEKYGVEAYDVMLQWEIIGRAKRAPYWGVQSRFRVIYVVGMSYVVCRMSVVCQINCVGGIT